MKNTELNRLIIESMDRSTTPQTGYSIYNKIRRNIKSTFKADDICKAMVDLGESGYIVFAGFDKDRDSLYVGNN